MTINKFIICGIDRLGKSTLISNIRQALGFFNVLHYQKPEVLAYYKNSIASDLTFFDSVGVPVDLLSNVQLELEIDKYSRYFYQLESFNQMMQILEGDGKFIFDRGHLGEYVYAPLYRGYEGDYVFALEDSACIDQFDDVRLILLTEDFEHSRHFVSDGQSFSDENRKKEQNLFKTAFERSMIADKRVICVTDPTTGQFRNPLEILEEAIS